MPRRQRPADKYARDLAALAQFEQRDVRLPPEPMDVYADDPAAPARSRPVWTARRWTHRFVIHSATRRCQRMSEPI